MEGSGRSGSREESRTGYGDEEDHPDNAKRSNGRLSGRRNRDEEPVATLEE